MGLRRVGMLARHITIILARSQWLNGTISGGGELILLLMPRARRVEWLK